MPIPKRPATLHRRAKTTNTWKTTEARAASRNFVADYLGDDVPAQKKVDDHENYRRRISTPAMAAGMTDKLWEISDVAMMLEK